MEVDGIKVQLELLDTAGTEQVSHPTTHLLLKAFTSCTDAVYSHFVLTVHGPPLYIHEVRRWLRTCLLRDQHGKLK